MSHYPRHPRLAAGDVASSLPFAVIAMAILAYACLGDMHCSLSLAAPTTQPGSRSPDYLNGWTDAGGTVATQPTTMPAIPLTYAGIQVAINSAPNALIDLPAGVIFSPYTYVISTPGVTIDGHGLTTLRKTGLAPGVGGKDPTNGAILKVQADGVTYQNIIFDTEQQSTATLPNPKTGVTAVILSSHDTSESGNLYRNVDTGIQCWPGQLGHTVHSGHSTWELRGDWLFAGGGVETSTPIGNFSMSNFAVDNSQREHPIRASSPQFCNFTATNCTFFNGNGKESLAIRQGRHFKFVNCTASSTMPATVQLGDLTTEAGQNLVAASKGKLTDPVAVQQSLLNDVEFSNCTLPNGYYSIRYATGVSIVGGSVTISTVGVAPGMENVAVMNSNGLGVSIQALNRIVIGSTDKPIFRGTVTDKGGMVTTIQPAAAKPAK